MPLSETFGFKQFPWSQNRNNESYKDKLALAMEFCLMVLQ